MKLDDLFKFHTCFHEAVHVACWTLEAAVKFPIEKISLWNEDHLVVANALATKLVEQATASGDVGLRDELLAVVAKMERATKFAIERRKMAAIEAKDAKRIGLLPGLSGDVG